MLETWTQGSMGKNEKMVEDVAHGGQGSNENSSVQCQEEWEAVRHSSADSGAELYSSPHLATILLPVVWVSHDQLAPENTN